MRTRAATCKIRTSAEEEDEGKSKNEEENEGDGERSEEKTCEEDINSDEDVDSDSGDNDDDSKEYSKNNTTVTRKRTMWLPLSFKDVGDLLQTFSGDGKQNIRKWMEEFEETSKICRWSEVQNIIYAKKLLRGSAKLFVS